jgi:hypothetical protein
MFSHVQWFEVLPVLVEGTKRHMQIDSDYDLKRLIRDVDLTLDVLERRDSKQGEGERERVTVAMKELRAVASDMLERLVNSKGVISP